MKKNIALFMVVLLLIIFGFPNLNVYAQNSYPNGSLEMIRRDPLYIQFLSENPDAYIEKQVTKYLVTETVVDSEKNIISSNTSEYTSKAFENLELSDKKIQIPRRINTKTISTLNIYPGNELTKTYSAIQVTLSFSKGTKYYFVSSSFEWLKLPNPGYLDLQGIVGLALAPQLGIDGTSYHAKIYYNKISNGIRTTGLSRDLTVNPSSVNGIGAKFSLTHQNGQGVSDYITALSGYISASASKCNTNDINCSAMASYAHIKLFRLQGGFSVSYPAGISISFGTSYDHYDVQDTLVLN